MRRSLCPLALLCLAAPAVAGPAPTLPPRPENPVPSASVSFAVDLYGRLAAQEPGKNLFFSPYSMFSALSMAAEGARGETASQMVKALRYPVGCGLPGRLGPIHAGVAAVNERFNDKDAGHELKVANALWVDNNTPVVKGYLNTITAHYRTGVYGVDFRKNAEDARLQINAWAAGQTRGRIKEILPDANKDARLVLTNAVYFRGQWARPFEVGSTEKADFLVNGRTKASVSMMSQMLKGGRYGAFEAAGTPFDTPWHESSDAKTRSYPGEGGFQVLEMPYKGGLSMVVVLPRSAAGLPALEKLLAEGKLYPCVYRLSERDAYAHLPKFRLATGHPMKPALHSLGMTRALEPFGADFGGIRETSDPMEKLHISRVEHKTFVAVDEQGTEAAAVTAVEAAVALSAAPFGEPVRPFIPEVKADHPFLFVIRDQKTGTILFMGRVIDPR